MSLSLAEFLDLIKASGIVSEADLAALQQKLPAEQRPEEPEKFARLLVKNQLLTAFQAQQIYAKRGKSLTLGNYQVLDKLGQGGMGVVLKARHQRMKRLVALKVMSAEAVKTPDLVKRFHREVEAAAKLTHPNIVIAFDADEANGTHFLVMEYVAGVDLQKHVKANGPMSVTQALQLILQAARGLEFAHQQGVVHRDIKPANLLMDQQGNLKILDMGLARIEGLSGGNADAAGLTSTGTIMGTVDYMSPEQAMDTKNADARSDIYSLGCSLYYLLTGSTVYTGDTVMKRLMAHQSGIIPQLEIEAAHSPENDLRFHSQSTAVNALFRQMVAKHPEERLQTMTAVITELEQCLSMESTAVDFQYNLGEKISGNSETEQFLAPLSSQSVGTAENTVISAISVSENPFADTLISSSEEVTTASQMHSSATAMLAGAKQTSPATSKQAPPRQKNSVRRLAFGGMALGLMLLLGVWLIIRDKEGNEVGRILVPVGGTVSVEEITPQAAGVTTSEILPAPMQETKPETSAPLWQPTPEQQAFFDEIAKLPAIQQGEAVWKKLREVNPEIEPEAEHHYDSYRDRIIGFHCKIDSRCAKHLEVWPLSGLPSLRILFIRRRDENYQRLMSEPRGEKVFDLAPLSRLKLEKFYAIATNIKDLTPLQNMPLTFLQISLTNITDLSPLRHMPLDFLVITSTSITDLSPLTGMPLRELWMAGTKVRDLSPLIGMQLDTLAVDHTPVTDISALAGMPLKEFYFAETKIADLSPLKGANLEIFLGESLFISDLAFLEGMPLKGANLLFSSVPEITPLKNSSLKTFRGNPRLFYPPDEEVLLSFSPETVVTNLSGNPTEPVQEFLKKFGEKRATAIQFAKETSRLPADEQVETVTAQLLKLNEGRIKVGDHKTENNQVVEIRLELSGRRGQTEQETTHDLTALRAFTQLQRLTLTGGTWWLDLSPLNSLPLEELNCNEQLAIRNAPIFQGMPTLKLINGKAVEQKPETDKSVPAWQPSPEQQAFFDEIAKLPVEQQAEAVWKKLREVNPQIEADAKYYSRIQQENVDRFEITSLARNLEIWPVGALVDLDWFHIKRKDKSYFELMFEPRGQKMTDLRPLGHLRLKSLHLLGADVEDLTPLQGMPITVLDISLTKVSDLSPLKGKLLTYLSAGNTLVTDVSPLAGMPLKQLIIGGTKIEDFSPLKDSPITTLFCNQTPAKDFSFVQGMPLTAISLRHSPVSDVQFVKDLPLKSIETAFTMISDYSPFQGKPLELFEGNPRLFHQPDEDMLRSLPAKTRIASFSDIKPLPAAEFLPAFVAKRDQAVAFAEETSRLPAQEQVSAVTAQLLKLNNSRIKVGEHKIENGQVTEIQIALTGIGGQGTNEATHDLTALRAFTQLQRLTLTGGTWWLDLSPLNSLPLEELNCNDNLVTRNTPILKGIATLQQINQKPVKEVLAD